MITTTLSMLFPNTHALLLLPNKAVAYGAIPFFGLRKPSAPKIEAAFTQDNFSTACSSISKTLQPRSEDVWYVGLPLKYFILTNLQLPMAASDSLEQAVRYALLRHVPFDLSQSRFGYARLGRGGESLDLEVSVMEEKSLRPLSAALTQTGMYPAGVFPTLVYMARTHGRDGAYVSGGQSMVEAVVLEKGRVVFHAWDDMPSGGTMVDFLRSISPVLKNRPQPPTTVFTWECALPPKELAEALDLHGGKAEEIAPVFSRTLLEKAPYKITLGRPESVAKHRASLWLLLGLVILFLFALMAFPFGGLLGKKAYLQRLEGEIARMKPQAEIIAEKRLEIQDSSDFIKNIALSARNRFHVVELLHELTQVLPGNAWLDSFVFAQGRVRVQGRADSATSIIEAMENSPLFRDVRFEAPVTKFHNRDVFQISAEVEH